jgi:hypothetical protein
VGVPPGVVLLTGSMSGVGSGEEGSESDELKGEGTHHGCNALLLCVTSGATVHSHSSAPSMLPAEGLLKMNAQRC